MPPAIKPHYLEAFQCLGPACPDTCCKQFTVLVDPATYENYQTKAPELLDFVTEKEGIGQVLAFDKKSGCCPKLENGACSIHANYGTDFLTDVCHLYPRITRQLGDQVIMAGTVSCPEIARLALFEEDAFASLESHTDRLPFNLKDYLPESLTATQAQQLHRKILLLAQHSLSAEVFLAKFSFFILRFGDKPFSEWEGILDTGWNVMEAMLPQGKLDERDPFFLLISLTTLLAAGNIQPSPRLTEILKMMQMALNCTIDPATATVDVNADSMQRALNMKAEWDAHYADPMQPIFKRLLMAKLESSLYPYAGLGANQQQRMSALVVHMATIKLGLMAYASVTGAAPDEPGTIHVVQTITRVLDHLSNLDFALPMYSEAGWLETPRLIGLMQ